MARWLALLVMCAGIGVPAVAGAEARSLVYPVYAFAGALNIQSGTVPKATAVQCANTHESASVWLELELYDFDAGEPSTGSISLEPLETATFESSQIDFYIADVFMNAGRVEQGLGRILASHSEVVCTAQTLDPENSPPTWQFDLPVQRLDLINGWLFQDSFESP